MGSFTVHCPHCGQLLEAQTEWIGMHTTCPTCQKQLEIPAQEQQNISDWKQTAAVSPQSTGPRLTLAGGVGYMNVSAEQNTSPKLTISSSPKRSFPTQQALSIKCKHCQTDFPIQESWRGAAISCPHCGGSNRIPMVGEPEETPAGDFLFICPECGNPIKLQKSLEGENYTCKFCGENVIAAPSETRQCPFCGEKIKIAAIVCKACHRNVPPVLPEMSSSGPALSSVRARGYAGVSPFSTVDNELTELASVGERWWALLLDILILIIPLILFTVIPVVGPFICFILYEAIMVKMYGATLGKKILHLKVVFEDSENGQPTWGQAFGRAGGKYLSNLLFGIGFLMACFNKEKKTLHDSLCHTSVVKILS